MTQAPDLFSGFARRRIALDRSAIRAGHFLAEEAPKEALAPLLEYLTSQS